LRASGHKLPSKFKSHKLRGCRPRPARNRSQTHLALRRQMEVEYFLKIRTLYRARGKVTRDDVYRYFICIAIVDYLHYYKQTVCPSAAPNLGSRNQKRKSAFVTQIITLNRAASGFVIPMYSAHQSRLAAKSGCNEVGTKRG
jgi:hypothetical protein